VGATKSVGQALKPVSEVVGGASCRGRPGKDNGLRPIAGLDVEKPAGRQLQRLVPRYTVPTGVRLSLRPSASHRVVEAVRGGDDLRSGHSFDADTPVGMLGVGGHLRQSPI